MDCSEISVEMAEEEPLVITEDGDIVEGASEKGAAISSDVAEQSCGDKSALMGKEDEKQEDVASEICLGAQNLEEQQHIDAGEDKQQNDKPENTNDGQNGGDSEREEQTHEKPEKPGNTEDEKVPQDEPQVTELNSPEQPPEGEQNQGDQTKAHRLTPDFPESLYELLCTLQEGRRLNDQRCSFRLQSGMRRRCHSEPNTSKPANRVVFSSMTSLQKEEFFDLVATAQARRLDDQRAQLGRAMPPKPKGRSFRGSIKQLSMKKHTPAPAPAPVPAPKEDLYDMILTTQAQGRLEDQRSRAPGPMDDEDFFSLLLRVQGGRMDEQRTELPRLLQT
ncbi:G-protein-signaling modulator 1 [Mugil cephalus]|uniref:G-protein-signaling modulator 1 n=1 Tax=Mugil cephalus TaxID=48193 RepID=UPI001FB5A105|nr:G-protein-signaling modulator 1 [Mugil cephalus]